MFCVSAHKSQKILPVEVLMHCGLSILMFSVTTLNDALQTLNFPLISNQKTPLFLRSVFLVGSVNSCCALSLCAICPVLGHNLAGKMVVCF